MATLYMIHRAIGIDVSDPGTSRWDWSLRSNRVAGPGRFSNGSVHLCVTRATLSSIRLKKTFDVQSAREREWWSAFLGKLNGEGWAMIDQFNNR